MRSLNRIVMQKHSRDWINSLGPEGLDVLELSGKWGQSFPFRNYRFANRWKFDPCKGPMLDEAGKVVRFDLILANQVWEHVDRPYAATRNIFRMLRPGGWFWLAVPFLAPFHGAPVDCSRWTARGLKNLLVEGGSRRTGCKAINGAIAMLRRGIWKPRGPRRCMTVTT